MCRQFQRVAKQDNATRRARYYLTGQSPDLRGDESLNEEDFMTTALHDAVKTSNYEVVEYLVRTNFIVNVPDGAGETALDVAERMARQATNDVNTAKHIKVNQIRVLLGQSKPGRPRSPSLKADRIANLPIGWEETKLYTGSLYFETSIDSDTNPITFIRPQKGLLEERRLALGQRMIAGSSGQTYYLDPLRFMHTKSRGNWKVDVASEPTYGDEWYLKEMKNVAEAPQDPLSDARRWYRITYRIARELSLVTSSLIRSIFTRYGFTITLFLALLFYDGT